MFQGKIVRLIAIEKKPEEALDALCAHYRVEKPTLRIGLPKGEKKALGCYVHKERAIYMSSEEYLFDPYVLIHEFYHHLRHVKVASLPARTTSKGPMMDSGSSTETMKGA